MFIVSVLLEELALDRGPAQPQVPYLGISLLALPRGWAWCRYLVQTLGLRAVEAPRLTSREHSRQ